jgi:hypothetical protein
MKYVPPILFVRYLGEFHRLCEYDRFDIADIIDMKTGKMKLYRTEINHFDNWIKIHNVVMWSVGIYTDCMATLKFLYCVP